MTGDPVALKASERIAIEGLMAREMQIQRAAQEALAPISAQYQDVFAEICQRLGLPTDALQTTHSIDAPTMTVRQRANPDLHVVTAEPVADEAMS